MTNKVEGVGRIVAVAFGGVFAGFLVTVMVLELSMRDLGASAYTQVRHVELDRLDTLATVTLLPTAVATIVLVGLGLRRGSPGLGLMSVALVLLLVVFITTIVVNLPINADQRDWSIGSPPNDWATDRDRWQVAHAVRTGATLLAYACLLLASRVHRQPALEPRLADGRQRELSQ
ncbi:anthrone oxygenase family protein [Aeromicrobium ginsengisoli]|uniref:DUF1772 domain-containing protein n=1 Tax=Aeromicrobium ginsengisoli TaxID=363867 RepID=A0A5M4FAW0_9ACTN|nr:anthrone oxygenase family protein [Aeromicrobium ginsengisoli]KAA1395498.1 DUF1772 domain-containing protein [Aeromicrobium ginsengisoli]